MDRGIQAERGISLTIPMNALRDCPFCGAEEPHMGVDGTVTCGNCGAKGPWDREAYDGAGNEQEMWNASGTKTRKAAS